MIELKFKKMKPLCGVWYKDDVRSYGTGIVIGINREEKYFLMRQGDWEQGKKIKVKFENISIISRKKLKEHCGYYAK